MDYSYNLCICINSFHIFIDILQQEAYKHIMSGING